jgi:hypothetical protein
VLYVKPSPMPSISSEMISPGSGSLVCVILALRENTRGVRMKVEANRYIFHCHAMHTLLTHGMYIGVSYGCVRKLTSGSSKSHTPFPDCYHIATSLKYNNITEEELIACSGKGFLTTQGPSLSPIPTTQGQ